MKHYLVLPKVFLCFVAVGVLSGCADIVMGIWEAGREIDTRGAWGVKTSKRASEPILPPMTTTKNRIKPRKSTKSDVLAMLSIPEEKTRDGRFFLYRYEMQTYTVRKNDNNVVERIPVGRLGGARFLIWFDQADIVKRYRLHVCKPTVESSLKCHSAYQMCEMIKGLQDRQLIAQYCSRSYLR